MHPGHRLRGVSGAQVHAPMVNVPMVGQGSEGSPAAPAGFPETVDVESSCESQLVLLGESTCQVPIPLAARCRWARAAAMNQRVNPFESCVFHGLQMSPWAATVNDLGLVRPDDRLGQCVVVGIAAQPRRARRRFGQPWSSESTDTRHPVAVMNDPPDTGPRPQRLLQGVQDQARCASSAPRASRCRRTRQSQGDIDGVRPTSRQEWSPRPTAESDGWPGTAIDPVERSSALSSADRSPTFPPRTTPQASDASGARLAPGDDESSRPSSRQTLRAP